MLFKWSDSEHTKHKMLKYLNTKNKNKLFVYLRQMGRNLADEV